MSQLLPKSIEMRALAYMGKGVDTMEAVKLAFEEEENMLWLIAKGVDMNTGRMRNDIKDHVQEAICKSVYNRINNTK